MAYEFCTVTVVQSPRKARQCFWCDEALPIGLPTVKVAAKWDGMFEVQYVHPECNAAWQRDPCNADDESCPYDHLRGKTCNETTDGQEGCTP